MSVLVTLWMKGDPKKLEETARDDSDRMQSIIEHAKENGLIAHRFFGTEDGQIMVIDEWPDKESFQKFFESASDRIGPLMQDAGVTSAPGINFWRKIDTGDDVGWGA
jgi:hypothetical protein